MTSIYIRISISHKEAADQFIVDHGLSVRDGGEALVPAQGEVARVRDAVLEIIWTVLGSAIGNAQTSYVFHPDDIDVATLFKLTFGGR